MTGLDYADLVRQVTANTQGIFALVCYAAHPGVINDKSLNPAMPFVVVCPEGKTTDPNTIKSAGDVLQWVEEAFSCSVVFANSGDLLAQQSAHQVPLYREALRAALLNYHPLPLTRTIYPIVEGDDSLMLFDQGARTGWNFSYSIRYQISTADGYVPTPVTPVKIVAIIPISNTINNSVVNVGNTTTTINPIASATVTSTTVVVTVNPQSNAVVTI